MEIGLDFFLSLLFSFLSLFHFLSVSFFLRQAGLEFVNPLAQLPKSWDYSCA
jgi:hypothetical protein